MTEPRTHARLPEAAAGAALYESFYLKACRPGGGLGVWIRYTVLEPPGGPAAGSLWCTLFDAAAPGPAAAKVTLAPDQLRRPAGGYLAVGAATFEPGHVAGATRLAERPDGCGFRLPGRSVTVEGAVEAPGKDLVGWVYADPAGGRHDTVNCSIATMRLVVHRQGHEPLALESAGGAAYELGMRERDHGVPLQPYPDGPQTPD